MNVLIAGAGKIGSLIAFLLAQSKKYSVFLADIHANNAYADKFVHFPNFKYVQLDANQVDTIAHFIKENNIVAVISSLPFYVNIPIAQVAAKSQVHYFDLTEDTATTAAVKSLAEKSETAFVPQCGLAPGFISIISNHLMQHFTDVNTVKMRVGALPSNSNNALKYALTWSTDGLINEYGNPCEALKKGKLVQLRPLEGLETLEFNGLEYEAFNTSGGIGSLVETCRNTVNSLTYKTIRYPGHCAKMKFLMNDLNLNEDRDTLKRILENSIPKTYQDVVLIYSAVTGRQNDNFIEESYFKKFYPKTIDGHVWTAIQLTTATSMCVIVDLVLQNPDRYHGFIRQEQFSYDEFLQNPFGWYYKE